MFFIWTYEKIGKLKELNEQGKSKHEIASILETSYSVINYKMRLLRIKYNYIPKPIDIFTEEEKIEITKLMEKNQSFKEIGKILSRDTWVIKRFCKTHKLSNVKESLFLEQNRLFIENKRKCRKCESIFPVEENFYENLCAKCHKQYNNNYYEEYKKNMTLEQCIHHKFKVAKRRSEQLNINFDLDEQFLLELWNKQNKLCYYTKLPMQHKKGERYCLSIDRINSDLGYTKDNIVLCCDVVNIMKCSLYKDEFIKLCKIIAKNFKDSQETDVTYTKPINSPV